MARKDRLLPPVALKISDYDAEHMEQYHKRMYKSFLTMRQNIGAEYAARADKKTIGSKEYYRYYNLKNNIAIDSNGYKTLRWHGMKEESIQEIIDFHNSTDLKWLMIDWENRKLMDSVFFNSIEPTIQTIISRRFGTYFPGAVETDLVQPQPLTELEQAVWDIYWGLGLLLIVDDAGEFQLLIDTTKRATLITNVETIKGYIIDGDMTRVYAAAAITNSADGTIYYLDTAQYVTYPGDIILYTRETLLSREAFENISQDNFFDIYATNIFINWKEDKSWWERFIDGLLSFIGDVINFILDVLLDIPLLGDLLEWVIEGIAGLFNLTFEEARALFIQAVVAIITLNLTVVGGGFSYWGYVEWLGTAWSLGGIAGEIAFATHEVEIEQITDQEQEELVREIEKIKHQAHLVIGREEPQIRLNRPEEELRVDGNNNSTYNIFRLD